MSENDNHTSGTPTPCLPYPDGASYKTIALAPCPQCGSSDCWRRYLSWEKSLGITINEKDHPAEVDPDHVKDLPVEVMKNAVAIAEVPITLAVDGNVFEVKLREPGIVRAVGFWLHEPKVVGAGARGMRSIAMPLLYVECNPQAPLCEKPRIFVFLPSGAEFAPRVGYVARFTATAFHAKGAMHLFELVEAAS